jgi:WD40 repeat protein
MVLAPDGSLLAMWDRLAGGIQLLNPIDGTGAGFLDMGASDTLAIDFSPDSSQLAVATTDTVMMWDRATQTRVPWGDGVMKATALAFSPNGQWVATVENDGAIRLREAATGREVRRFVGTTLRAHVLCFSPDSTRLLSGGADRTVRLWDVESGGELLALPGTTERVTGLAWDGKNDRIYALDCAVRVWGTNRK